MTDQACGTYNGYQRHKRRKEPICPECRSANTEYHRVRRAEDPSVRPEERRRQYARNRALSRLARKFPRTYAEYYAQELQS